MHLQDALDRYLLQLRADGRADNTLRQYERHVGLLLRWLADERPEMKTIADLDHEDVAAFLASPTATRQTDGRRKTPGSMNALRTSLRCFLAYAHKAGYACRDAGRLVRHANTGTPPPRAMSEDEVRRFRDALEAHALPRDRVLFELMLQTGIRLGSALGLEVEDLDLAGGAMLLRGMKGGRSDRVFLPPAAVDLLRDHLQQRETGPVFEGPGGKRLSPRHAQRVFRQVADAAGLHKRLSPHALRHSFAMRLYERTRDLLLVKEALSHRSITSTLAYTRIDEGQLRAALS